MQQVVPDGDSDENISSDGGVCIGPDARDERDGAGPATLVERCARAPGAIGPARVRPGDSGAAGAACRATSWHGSSVPGARRSLAG
jgi:hypothetical protein